MVQGQAKNLEEVLSAYKIALKQLEGAAFENPVSADVITRINQGLKQRETQRNVKVEKLQEIDPVLAALRMELAS
jgi:hypothetical protein